MQKVDNTPIEHVVRLERKENKRIEYSVSVMVRPVIEEKMIDGNRGSIALIWTRKNLKVKRGAWL